MIWIILEEAKQLLWNVLLGKKQSYVYFFLVNGFQNDFL